MNQSQNRSLSAVKGPLVPLVLLVALAGIALSWYAGAETGAVDDLTDNETCLDCHIDQEHFGTLEVDGAQVHNPDDGSLLGEGHAEMACIDCHGDIEEIPHREDVDRTVDCLACHESVPE